MLARMSASQLPLRARLTLWYTLSLGLILLLFASFLYTQVRRSLIDQVDAALRLAAAQALINLDEDAGQLVFGVERNPEAVRRLNDDFVIYLREPGGAVLSTLSNDDNLPLFPLASGATTMSIDGESWRVYSQDVPAGDHGALLQVGQELDPIVATLTSLRTQLLLGLSLALLLAGLGGFFLAGRALRPIDQITRIAQAITASDLVGSDLVGSDLVTTDLATTGLAGSGLTGDGLGRRIQYQGPADEVGRLAQTFDNMLDRLQEAFVRERRFTSDAAHELRTPLAALKGRIGVTLSRPRQPVAYEASLQEMEGQVDRLVHLSNDLLFMARLDQGRFKSRFDAIALGDLLGAVVDQVRPLAEDKRITLVKDIPGGLTIQGDLELLIRLFLNLLDNAVKYTPENGRVTIRGQQAAQGVKINISDNGPGIAAGHLAHLFEPFYRVEDDRARTGPADNQSGAGLGLAIAHEIVRAHAGTLTVQSEVGQGTTFSLFLPCAGS